MSTLSIVALTILASLFAILLIAAISALVYVHLLVRRQLSLFTLTLDNAKSKIDSNYARMEALVGTINGQKITEAVNRFLEQIPRQAQTATRIEQACLAFQSALKLISEEQDISGSAIDRARASGLLPDSYASAAPGESFLSRSRVAEGDAIALQEESGRNTSSSVSAASFTSIDHPDFPEND